MPAFSDPAYPLNCPIRGFAPALERYQPLRLKNASPAVEDRSNSWQATKKGGCIEMETLEGSSLNRKQIAIRFLYTLLFLIIFEIVKLIVQIAVLFQYVYLFVTMGHSDPVRRFSNKAAVFAYKLVRYMTLNENTRPFPFTDFPQEMDAPEPEPLFD
jgi:hypothetical protein